MLRAHKLCDPVMVGKCVGLCGTYFSLPYSFLAGGIGVIRNRNLIGAVGILTRFLKALKRKEVSVGCVSKPEQAYCVSVCIT